MWWSWPWRGRGGGRRGGEEPRLAEGGQGAARRLHEAGRMLPVFPSHWLRRCPRPCCPPCVQKRPPRPALSTSRRSTSRTRRAPCGGDFDARRRRRRTSAHAIPPRFPRAADPSPPLPPQEQATRKSGGRRRTRAPRRRCSAPPPTASARRSCACVEEPGTALPSAAVCQKRYARRGRQRSPFGRPDRGELGRAARGWMVVIGTTHKNRWVKITASNYWYGHSVERLPWPLAAQVRGPHPHF